MIVHEKDVQGICYYSMNEPSVIWQLSVGKRPVSCMGLTLSTLFLLWNMSLGLKVGKTGELFYSFATTLFLSCFELGCCGLR